MTDASGAVLKGVPRKPAKNPPPPFPPVEDDEELEDDPPARRALKTKRKPGEGVASEDGRTLAEVILGIALRKEELAELEVMARKNVVVDKFTTLAIIETLSREVRDGLFQFPDKYAAEIAKAVDADPHRIYVALNEAMKSHLRKTIERIDIARYAQLIETFEAKFK
jgi:hypothetical protein